jgi:hypothetical protein
VDDARWGYRTMSNVRVVLAPTSCTTSCWGRRSPLVDSVGQPPSLACAVGEHDHAGPLLPDEVGVAAEAAGAAVVPDDTPAADRERQPAQALLEREPPKARLVRDAGGPLERTRSVLLLQLQESEQVGDRRSQPIGTRTRRDLPVGDPLPRRL